MLADQELRANVVDVRRFSTHDGTGIRTTIFLMGCSLACQWCQNPEAIEGRLRPVFFPTRCIQCGLCVEHATNGEARWETDGTVAVDTTREAHWEHLAAICPTKAITFNGTTHSVAELVSMALRDRVFYGDGGGVTISGGEPLFWPHFTARLLERLQQEGVHTAIETALNVRQEFLAACLPVVNLAYADLKLVDPVSHQRWIGHDNAQILRNVEYLLTSVRRDDVIMRTPLIPGITATDDNIHAVAHLVSASTRTSSTSC